MKHIDIYQAFLLDDLDIRGALVRLGPCWQSLLRGRDYPAPVQGLLGQFAAVTVLLGANMKQEGRLTFQLKGSGPVELLIMDCDAGLRLRGMARTSGPIQAGPVPDLLGHGQLAMTLDMDRMETPYQSLVPLAGTTLAEIFEHFLAHSEQQPTRLHLMADGRHAAGLMLQKLPSADARDPDGWNRIQHLTGTLRDEELGDLEPSELLLRLYPEETVRIFDPRPVRHHCPKDWEKVRSMLQMMGQEECEAALGAHGHMAVHDDICNHDYIFDADAIAALFQAKTLH